MGSVFDLSELDEFAEELLELSEEKAPKAVKKFMKKEGRKLRTATAKKARAKTDKKTGNYYKGIKAGKVYTYEGNGGTAIRVYGGKPAKHAHLIEYGHRQVQKGKVVNAGGGNYITIGNDPESEGVQVGFVKGLNVFGETRKEFANVFYDDVEGFLDEVAKKI